MVEHPASTRVVDDAPVRSAPLVRSEALDRDTNLADPRNAVILASAARVTGDSVVNPGRAPTLSDVSIVDGDQVLAGTDKKPLSENTLNAAKVRGGEGYFQSAERLLGRDFTHNEKKQFTDALKKNWATDHPDANTLRRGDELLTEKNRDAVLNNIADPALRARIADRLNKGLPEGGTAPRHEPGRDTRQEPGSGARQEPGRGTRQENIPVPRPRPEVRQEPVQEPAQERVRNARPTRGIRRPESEDAIPPPPDRGGIPDGPVKREFEARYNVGDRFKGLTSTYGAEFNGRTTASGLVYNNDQMTAASRELPFGTILSVWNGKTGKEVQVVITDKGPFAGTRGKEPDGRRTYERVIDLSTRADKELGRPGLQGLHYKILYIPEGAQWGMKRPVVHGAERQDLEATVRRLSRR